MMLLGLSRRPSTSRSRIWPSLRRPAMPLRLGPTSPCDLSSGAGMTWHTAQLPRSRLNTMSRPRAASPGWPVNEPGIASAQTGTAVDPRARTAGTPYRAPASDNATKQSVVPAGPTSRLLQLHVLERQRVDGLAGRHVQGVQHRRRRHADGGL